MTLSIEQRTAYAQDGFLALRGLIAPDEIALIRDTFMAQASDGPVPGLSDMRSGSPTGNDPLARYPRMMHPHKHDDKPVGPLARRYMQVKKNYMK